MTASSERGFTIVETVLFLAITGALFAALMIGVGTGITQQRYIEGVRGYRALLQDQYSAAMNIVNEHDAGTVACPSGAPVARGMSNCVILGRAVKIVGAGTQVETSSIIGSDTGTVTSNTPDVDAVRAYAPQIATFDRETTELDWGLALKTTTVAGSSHASQAVILIMRSPVSGLPLIFTSDRVPSPLRDMITTANRTLSIENCLTGDSGALPKQLVRVKPQIASADAFSSEVPGPGVCS